MRTQGILLALIVIALFVAGCTQLGRAGDQPLACPEPAEGTDLLSNDRFGYCFLYPDTYTLVETERGDLLVIDSVMNHVDPRVDVTVVDAAGRSATDAAETTLAELPAGVVIEQSAVTLDEVTAVVVDNVPGQEISRLVFVVNDDRLYQLTFTHSNPDLGEAYTQMQNLYTVVTNSFHFLPQQ